MAKKAAEARLRMLSGDEDGLRRRALSQALDQIGLKSDDFDVAHLDGSTTPSEWLAQAGTAPFLAEKRVVIVRNLLRCEVDAGKGLGWDSLPETALLILVADEESGDESRQQRLKTVRKNWEKLVTSVGGAVTTFDVSPRELQSAIRAEAERLEKGISTTTTELLAEMTGGSLTRAIEELEKLSLFVGTNKTITEADVRQVVVPAREWNVFKLSDAIVRNDMKEAVRQLRVLVASPTKAEEAAFRSVLPQLSRQLKLLWQGRICVDARVDPGSPPPEVGRLFPEKPNLSSEPSYRQNAIMGAARKVTFSQLTQGFALLSDTDARLKGLLPSYSSMETLERMVLEMGQAFSRA